MSVGDKEAVGTGGEKDRQGYRPPGCTGGGGCGQPRCWQCDQRHLHAHRDQLQLHAHHDQQHPHAHRDQQHPHAHHDQLQLCAHPVPRVSQQEAAGLCSLWAAVALAVLCCTKDSYLGNF